MTFPTVASSSSSWNAASLSVHSLTVPASIAAGDLLIAILGTDGNPTYTWPSGWTQLFTVTSGTAVKSEARWRTAAGGESTLTVGTSVGEADTWNYLRITGHDTAHTPESATSFNTTKPDPPSLNPGAWDAEDTLWLCWGATDAGGADNDDITAVSGSYTLIANHQVGVDAGSANGALGSRNVNAASEDPGVYTTATNEDTVSATIAIRPAGGGGGAVFSPYYADYYSRLIIGAT